MPVMSRTTVTRTAVTRLVRAAAAVTTPMVPDDVFGLFSETWSSTEHRARVLEVRRETSDSVTVVLQPGRALPRHLAGQYVRFGVDIDGVRHWRTYSLTTPPGASTLAITVKAVPGGLVSQHVVHALKSGAIVRLDGPYGEFVLSEGDTAMLFVSAGSGITPLMGMLRTLHSQRRSVDLVMIHSAPTKADVIFDAELAELATELGITLHVQHTDDDGMLTFEDVAAICPDWQARDAWVCGPGPMLDAAAEHWTSAELPHRLTMERFLLVSPTIDASETSEVSFERSQRRTTANAAQSLLDAGESADVLMPSGCRMGICHTCVLPLKAGKVRDLRTGEIHGEAGDLVQTCVSAACTDTVLDV